jgi:chloramphenicol-sensitive protein RarD
MTEGRKGLLLGLAAYAIWGASPLYWPLLEPAGAVELLAHRIIWSAILMVLLVRIFSLTGRLRALVASARELRLLAAAAVLISVHWGLFIAGVNSNRVVETSLGYFMSPLVMVLAGVVILGERLQPIKWVAVAIAVVAVLGITLDEGSPPWLALLLAFTFAGYGLLKKKANAGAMVALTVETLIVAPFALTYLVWLGVRADSQTLSDLPWHPVLLATSGVVTALPLIFFGGAATRVSLSTLGLMQYLNPTMQFLIGAFVLNEPMSGGRWVGFSLIWVALAVFTVAPLIRRRNSRAASSGGTQGQDVSVVPPV